MIEDTVGLYLTHWMEETENEEEESTEEFAGLLGDIVSLCIIETRATFWLPQVLRNALQEFPECPVYLVAPRAIHEWLSNSFPEVRPIEMPAHNGSRNTFNGMMYNPDFWGLFATPYVLMFQCDTCFVRGAASRLRRILETKPVPVYYGAACGPLHPATFIMNGGLSLRHVDTFKETVKTLTIEQMERQDEDIVFSRVLRDKGYLLPTIQQCMEFAVESYGNPSRVIGLHGSDKYYAPRPLLSALFGNPKKPIIDCIMYDGEPILRKRINLLGNIVDRFVVVESTVTHSGHPKKLQFPKQFPHGHPKITYVVMESFPPVPVDFGALSPWINEDSKEAWWRERLQRDEAAKHIPDVDGLVIVSDVDELPNPCTLISMTQRPDCEEMKPLHLEQKFLLYSPQWLKVNEHWNRAYICGTRSLPFSLTDERCRSGPTVLDGGWHCSSFFDVETHIRKVQHFAHREFGNEVDVQVIKERIQQGKDPYGRGEAFDGSPTQAYTWIEYLD